MPRICSITVPRLQNPFYTSTQTSTQARSSSAQAGGGHFFVPLAEALHPIRRFPRGLLHTSKRSLPLPTLSVHDGTQSGPSLFRRCVLCLLQATSVCFIGSQVAHRKVPLPKPTTTPSLARPPPRRGLDSCTGCAETQVRLSPWVVTTWRHALLLHKSDRAGPGQLAAAINLAESVPPVPPVSHVALGHTPLPYVSKPESVPPISLQFICLVGCVAGATGSGAMQQQPTAKKRRRIIAAKWGVNVQGHSGAFSGAMVVAVLEGGSLQCF